MSDTPYHRRQPPSRTGTTRTGSEPPSRDSGPQDLIIRNAAELVSMGGGFRSGPAAMGDPGIITGCDIAIRDGRITAVGRKLPLRGEQEIDATGKVVMPGFVDPHTHLVFAGSRERELGMKIRGKTYLEILEAGGGILSTVASTRSVSLEELVTQSERRLDTMLEYGTTTAEVKSGYGLDTATELKQLLAIRELNSFHEVDLIPTFLGAHAVPEEFRGDTDGYVDLLVGEMIPAVAARDGSQKGNGGGGRGGNGSVEVARNASRDGVRGMSRDGVREMPGDGARNTSRDGVRSGSGYMDRDGERGTPRDTGGTGDETVEPDGGDGAESGPLARFIDVFCEKGVFSVPQSRRILEAGKRHGLLPKLHADEIVWTGGAELAAEVGAVSADHLLRVSDTGIRDMKRAGVVATLLPATPLMLLQHEFADGRKMVDAGLTVALATDLNPNCYTESMQLAMTLACAYSRLTPAEALCAATINAAAALRMDHEIGSLEVGKKADILMLDVPNHLHIPYHFGVNLVELVVKAGEIVVF